MRKWDHRIIDIMRAHVCFVGIMRQWRSWKMKDQEADSLTWGPQPCTWTLHQLWALWTTASISFPCGNPAASVQIFHKQLKSSWNALRKEFANQISYHSGTAFYWLPVIPVSVKHNWWEVWTVNNWQATWAMALCTLPIAGRRAVRALCRTFFDVK